MPVQTDHSALAILSLLHPREALTLPVVAPPNIVAIVRACPRATVGARPLAVAHALAILALATTATVERTLDN